MNESVRAVRRQGAFNAILVIMGVALVGGSWYSGRVLGFLVPLGEEASIRTISWQLLVTSAPVLVGALLVLALVFSTASGELRTKLRAPWRAATSTLLISAVLSVILDWMRLWPFTWHWDGQPGAVFALEVVGRRAWLTALMALVILGGLGPLTEEVVFRFGLQTLLRRLPAGVWITVSGLLFALAHYGPDFVFTRIPMAHGAWLVVLGMVAATIVVMNPRGGLGLAIAVHAGRNTAELLMLFLAANVSLRT